MPARCETVGRFSLSRIKYRTVPVRSGRRPQEEKTPALAGHRVGSSRRELFAHKALALTHGRLALTVENGRVVTVDR